MRKKSQEFLVNPDFEAFIDTLNRHGVDYCITGAFAVGFHAEPRYTHDIDFYISKKEGNAKKIAKAIKDFFGEGIPEDLFNKDKTIVRIGVEPNKIELSNHLHGLDDQTIRRHKVENQYGKIKVFYIGLEDLIKNKGIIKDLPHRGLKKLQDAKDYLTLKSAKKRRQ